MTKKLFYQNPYLSEFSSEVRSCTEMQGQYAVVLAETLFYPEGGGQPADRGELGGFPVVGIYANVYDGSYHEVDSSEMAFHIAGFSEMFPYSQIILGLSSQDEMLPIDSITTLVPMVLVYTVLFVILATHHLKKADVVAG